MKLAETSAPSYEHMRPLKSLETDTFPVYRELVSRLLAVKEHPNATVAHVLGVGAGYAYGDENVVSTILARMGLEQNRVMKIEQTVDAMFIRSTAYVIQSQCGRLVTICYRGTEPTNAVNWLTDADVNPEKVTFEFAGQRDAFEVHGGFYRNVRSTRHEMIRALMRAADGHSIVAPYEKVPNRLQGLYVTGHSLGGAMASLFGLMLLTEPSYAPLAAMLKGIYTFGQPMIGDSRLAEACQSHPFFSKQLIRYVYGHDVVPVLPPKASGDFAHFGLEQHYSKRGNDGQWSQRDASGQLSNLFELSGAAFAFVAQQFKALRNFPAQHSIYDHSPNRYIAALTPPGIRSEFGD